MCITFQLSPNIIICMGGSRSTENSKLGCGSHFINPRRACAARVTVVGFVCVSVKSHLTYRASVRPENAVTYSAGNEGRKICGDFPETTAFKSYAAEHERKSQYANYSDLPAVSFLGVTYSKAPD